MQATEFVKSYIEAWNHHDPEEVADHLAVNGIYRDIPERAQRSHDELITSLYSFFGQFRHRYELLGEVLSNNDTVAFQYRMIPSTYAGRDHNYYQGAEFITLRDDSALLIIDYYEASAESQRSIVANPRRQCDKAKYAKSGLADEQLQLHKRALGRLMRNHELYLRPGLTLPQLAEAVGCSVNHLSQVINAGFGVGFFDFINRHRVEHAKALLENLDQHGAVLNVAFTVGFNSNSAFYSAFKKHVGMTPAQFRRIRRRMDS
jgi:AraC-like DNA-binding protein